MYQLKSVERSPVQCQMSSTMWARFSRAVGALLGNAFTAMAWAVVEIGIQTTIQSCHAIYTGALGSHVQVAQLVELCCLECRVSWVRSYLKQLIFLWKSDCLGCAVLLCLVVCLTLLASVFPLHLSLNMYIHIYTMYVLRESNRLM